VKSLKVITNKLAAALAGRADKVNVRATRGGLLHRAVAWVTWNRRNARLTFIITVSVLVLAFLVFTRLTAYQREMAAWEAQQAADTAAAQQAAHPTVTPTPEITFKELGATDTESTTPIPEPKITLTPLGQATPTGTPVVVSGATAVEKAPQAAAGAFLKTWTAAASYKTTGAWLDALAPYTTQPMLDLFKLTDVTQVPTAKVKALTSVTTGSTSAVDAVMADGSRLTLALEAADGHWKVTDLDEAAR